MKKILRNRIYKIRDLNFKIRKIIHSKKDIPELEKLLSDHENKQIRTTYKSIFIEGIGFYNFNLKLESDKLILEGRPKNKVLIFAILFLIIWFIGSIVKYSVAFGLISSIVFFTTFFFVHKRMLELSIDEIIETIRNS